MGTVEQGYAEAGAILPRRSMSFHPMLRAPSERPGTLARWLTVVALLGSAACGGGPAGAVVYDFLERAETAHRLVETGRVDFGRPAARAIMAAGWYVDERWNGETPFVWGIGRRSTLHLPLVEARPLRLALTCRALSRDLLREDVPVPRQAVSVLVNGWRAGTLLLDGGFQTYHVDVPGDVVRAGSNFVEFQYLFSPREDDLIADAADDGIDRVVAWDALEFDHVVSLDAPRVTETTDAAVGLLLPFNTGVEYFALATDAVLRLGALRAWGEPAPDARLEIRVGTDQDPDAGSFEIAPSRWTQPDVVRLPASVSGQPVRVSFIARSNAKGPIAGGLAMEHPALIAPRPTDARPESVTVGDTERSSPSTTTASPNILVYLIDTLRADRLGVYGYDKPTSPNMDALARDGIVFSHALAQSSWTRPSVASLFTGLHPRSHTVNGRSDALPPTATTLASVLGAAGYQTAAFVTNGNVSQDFGFDLGFDDFVYLGERDTREMHVQSDVVNDRVFTWIENRDGERPFFLYVHASDPHDPYAPRSPFRDRFVPAPRYPDRITIRAMHERPPAADQTSSIARDLSALYDAEIAFNDQHVGRLLDHLKARDLYDSTIVLVVSDHGEEFYEHEFWGHGDTLYGEQLRVPFVLKLPHQASAGRVVDGLAQHLDVMPTILDLVGVPPVAGVQGRSLKPVIGGAPSPSVPAVAYVNKDGHEIESYQMAGYKIIRSRYQDAARWTSEIYDLRDDPGELDDLVGPPSVLSLYLASELEDAARHLPPVLTADEAIVDEEIADRLRRLGYIR